MIYDVCYHKGLQINYGKLMDIKVSAKKSRFISVFMSLLLLAFPLRESFALMLGETPMRMGEMLMGLCPIVYFLYNKNYRFKNRAISNYLIVFLLFSLVFGVIFAHYLKTIYVLKYYIRGLLFYFLIRIAEDKVIILQESMIEKLFKYTLVIETFFCLMQLTGFNILYGEFQSYSMSAEFGIPRLSGTASEPGYLIPILAPGFYYFICNLKKYKIWACASFLLFFFTFSSFGYVTLLLIVFIKIWTNNKNAIAKYFFSSALVLTISLIGVSFVYPSVGEVIDSLSGKILAFATMNEDEMDYSGAERSENLIVAIDGFNSGSIYEKLFGQGLGATAFYTNKNVVLHSPAEEAGNVYLCTLINQGIIGLLLLILLLWKIWKKVIKTPASVAMFVGFLTQLLQYFIVGNIWLYFFWYEIAFIIILYNQSRTKNGLQAYRNK